MPESSFQAPLPVLDQAGLLQTVQSGAEADWGEGHDMPSEIELSDPVMARSPSGKPPLGRSGLNPPCGVPCVLARHVSMSE